MARASGGAAPLILTLGLDGLSQERFDRLRRTHFPPERNHIPAHLTLLHRLPGDREAEIVADVEEVCERQARITPTGLLFLGRGVAYTLDSPDLEAVRGRLAEEWAPWLTAQDHQRFRPHVTVRNKVAPEKARALHEELRAEAPFEVRGESLKLWRYAGGPWEPAGTYPFGR